MNTDLILFALIMYTIVDQILDGYLRHRITMLEEQVRVLKQEQDSPVS